MKTLILGASGATGQKLVDQLIDMGHSVIIIVRTPEKLPSSWHESGHITIIKGEILKFSVDEIAVLIRDCIAVASCLGHNISFKGIYGKPRRLVRDSVKLVCEAIRKNKPDTKKKFVLMNTVGNSNRDLNESRSIGERIVISLLRVFLPPHPDNEQAADYLRVDVGPTDKHIEWVAVRPDSLIDQEKVTKYTLHPSPTTGLFKPNQTSRINVANFMARLIVDGTLWADWKGQMPVIYNQEKNMENK
jgi:nucleoside-diphosphate-sugar epimerase